MSCHPVRPTASLKNRLYCGREGDPHAPAPGRPKWANHNFDKTHHTLMKSARERDFPPGVDTPSSITLAATAFFNKKTKNVHAGGTKTSEGRQTDMGELASLSVQWRWTIERRSTRVGVVESA